MRLIQFASALVGAAFLAVDAQAAGFNLFIDPQFGSTENTGSTAQVFFEFTEQGNDDLLTLTITNTTPTSIQSSLTGVGFEVPRPLIDPTDVSLLFTDGYFAVLTANATFAPPWLTAPGGYDLALTGEGDLLGGDPQGAPRSGESTTVILGLGDTGLSPDGLADEFLQFYLSTTDRFLVGRFQVVGRIDDSDKVGGGVPEPATLLLLVCGGLTLYSSRHKPAKNLAR